ncbi:uncharacterized mitochondrial protein AtMg00860-like [Benincasa hispida]|uniref:uncharacterized mitochondrial protein AtMg00860-like n=1 Tax=Benincasa hispida TaxID=102211 RepID=UPI0019011C3C|nr:uncharacterized mitochondrial protein AtMg00860-like [Benincasa hispida]
MRRNKFGFELGEMPFYGRRRNSVGSQDIEGRIGSGSSNDAIAKLPTPVNVKKLRSFLGHAGIYRRFIHNFSQIARPLSALLEIDRKYEFNDAYAEAFHTLRNALITVPILVTPDWTQPFALMCDEVDMQWAQS